MCADTPAPRPAPQAERWENMWGVFSTDDGVLVAPPCWTREMAEKLLAERREAHVPGAYHVAPVTVLPDIAPLPPDVVARAREEDRPPERIEYDHGQPECEGSTVDEVAGHGSYHVEHLGEAVWMQLGTEVFQVSVREGELVFWHVESRATPRPAPAGEVG